MGFLAPMMLLGALAAAIPIALHLIHRSRPTVIPWAAMEFLLKSIKETQAASRLRDLLLLLCRIAVLVLAALALARPTASFVPPSGPVEAVFLVDLSRSMSTLEGTDAAKSTRLDIARARLAKMLESLPVGSRASVIPFTDRVLTGMADPLVRDPAAVRDGISRLVATDLPTRLGPAWEEAVSRIRLATLPQTQIHILSDAGATAWREAGESLREMQQRLPESTRIQWVRVGSPVTSHVQILDVQPIGGLVFAGKRQGWRVRIKNPATEPVRGIQVVLGDNRGGNAEEAPLAELAPGEERVVSIEAMLDKPGPQAVEIVATYPGARLAADGKSTRVVTARDRYRVLMVEETSLADPTRGNGYFLAHALRSLAGEGIVCEERGVGVENRTPLQLTTGLLAGIDTVYLCGVNPTSLPVSFIRELEEWCNNGQVAFLMGAAGPAPTGSTTGLMGAFARLQKTVGTIPKESHPDPVTAKAWFEPFSRPPLDRLGRVVITKPMTLDDSNGSTTLLRFTGGKALISTIEQGRGEFDIGAIGLDTADGDLPLGPVFVPFVGAMVGHAEEHQSLGRNILAGDLLSIRDNSEAKNRLWRGPGDLTLPATTPPQVLQAGIWHLEEGGVPVPQAVAAVTADPSEGADLNPAPAELVQEIVGPRIQVTEAGSLAGEVFRDGIDPGEMAGWILPGVLALLLLEGFVAWWAGRPL